ncbi:hypothetical protein [Nocardia sp. NBC_01388]|uniref:hypothetical protein n=1 Tax=Nocardia sp. NBC_01388 TaxID=2903596 RepID=UPI003249ECCB
MSSATAATPRTYRLRDFAETYVLAQANWSDPIGGYHQDNSAYNAALRIHRERLLGALEELFGLELNMKNMVEIPRGTVLFMHFKSTVLSCLALRTPGHPEAGLLLRSLEAAGDPGKRVVLASTRIDKLLTLSKEAHLDLLEDLLRILLGPRADDTFTASDLRSCGMVDTPPTLAEYS